MSYDDDYRKRDRDDDDRRDRGRDDRGRGDREDRGRGGGGGQWGNEENKLFVGNLSRNASADMLRRAFDKFGELTDVFVPKDNDTNQSRGFGFVTFEDQRDMEDAMREMNGVTLDGQQLRVNKPQPRGERGAGGGGGGRGGYGGGHGGGGGYGGGDRSSDYMAGSSAGRPYQPSGEGSYTYDRVTGNKVRKAVMSEEEKERARNR